MRAVPLLTRRASLVDHSHPAVSAVDDDEVPGAVDHDRGRVWQPRGGGWAAVTGVARGAVPGDGVDVPRDHGLAEEGARGVGDHVVPRAARCYPAGGE